MTRSSICFCSAASVSRLASADDADPMIIEYIIKPNRIMVAVNTCSCTLRGEMFSPMDVVAMTAHMIARQYCAVMGWLAHDACGTQISG